MNAFKKALCYGLCTLLFACGGSKIATENTNPAAAMKALTTKNAEETAKTLGLSDEDVEKFTKHYKTGDPVYHVVQVLNKHKVLPEKERLEFALAAIDQPKDFGVNFSLYYQIYTTEKDKPIFESQAGKTKARQGLGLFDATKDEGKVAAAKAAMTAAKLTAEAEGVILLTNENLSTIGEMVQEKKKVVLTDLKLKDDKEASEKETEKVEKAAVETATEIIEDFDQMATAEKTVAAKKWCESSIKDDKCTNAGFALLAYILTQKEKLYTVDAVKKNIPELNVYAFGLVEITQKTLRDDAGKDKLLAYTIALAYTAEKIEQDADGELTQEEVAVIIADEADLKSFIEDFQA